MRPEDVNLQYTLNDREMLMATKNTCEAILVELKTHGANSSKLEDRVDKLEKWQAKLAGGMLAVGAAIGWGIHIFRP